MADFRAFAWSSVTKKLITGVTGILLTLFLIAHLTGNLLLYVGPEAFNEYAYFLEHAGHGAMIYLFEAGLILFFIFHILAGISVARNKRAARTQGYVMVRDAGGPSRKSVSSRSMIVTGLIILLFVVIHVRMFKFGDTGMVESAAGHEMKDLYTLVVLAFKDVPIMLFYTVVMVLIGLHLRHGVWSAFQSLGVTNPRLTPVIYVGGVALAAVLAVGFLLIPLVVFFGFEQPVLVGGGS